MAKPNKLEEHPNVIAVRQRGDTAAAAQPLDESWLRQLRSRRGC